LERINKHYVSDYLQNLIPDHDPLMAEFRRTCEASHIPIIHKEVGQLIRFLIQIKQATRVLEIGTAVGFSAIFMSRIINDPNGYITTLERSPHMLEKAHSNLENYEHPTPITLLQGEATELLPRLTKPYDILFLDGAKSKYQQFYQSAKKCLVPGGLIISDNVLHKGMTATDSLVVRRQRTIVREMRAYLDYLSTHPDLETTVLPLGDGVAISYIKP